VYCSICGGFFSVPTLEDYEFLIKHNINYDWLEDVKIISNGGTWKYDMYGKFYKGSYDKRSEVETETDDCQCIHVECWKLNGKNFKGVGYDQR
jgi:hypothetical protein